MDLDAYYLHEHALVRNTRYLGNIHQPKAVGHIFFELDNFLRMKHLTEIDERISYAAFLPTLSLARSMVQVYPHLFEEPELLNPGTGKLQFVFHDNMARLSFQLHQFRPELFVDVGTSGFKTVLRDESARRQAGVRGLADMNVVGWYLNNHDAQQEVIKYKGRILKSPDFRPLSNTGGLTPELVDFLGGRVDKLAAVHIRYKRTAANAGTLTEPAVLGPTLAYLKDCGYTVFKIGTEPYPEEFSRYSVVNYSDSPLRTFANDIKMLGASKITVVNASGMESIPEVMEVPLVSYGRWHVSTPPTSFNCVIVPSLLRRRMDGKLLSFAEQLLQWRTRPEPWTQFGTDDFPEKDYEERPPNAEELVAAVREAIELGANPTPRTADQEYLFALDRPSYVNCKARVSQFFIEANREHLL